MTPDFLSWAQQHPNLVSYVVAVATVILHFNTKLEIRDIKVMTHEINHYRVTISTTDGIFLIQRSDTLMWSTSQTLNLSLKPRRPPPPPLFFLFSLHDGIQDVTCRVRALSMTRLTAPQWSPSSQRGNPAVIHRDLRSARAGEGTWWRTQPLGINTSGRGEDRHQQDPNSTPENERPERQNRRQLTHLTTKSRRQWQRNEQNGPEYLVLITCPHRSWQRCSVLCVPRWPDYCLASL